MLTSDEKSIFKSQILAKHPLFQGFTNITMCDSFASQIKAIWGPKYVTFETALGCCVECLLDSLEIGDDDCSEPIPTRQRRAKKPKRTLRDAIKESIRTSESEQDESKKSDETVKSDTHRKPATKKVKNQGKARTFKRKTKKPGRV